MKQAMIGLCVLAFAYLVAVVCQCSQQMAIDTETAMRHSNRDVQPNSAQYPREIVIDCRAEVKVHLERECTASAEIGQPREISKQSGASLS